MSPREFAALLRPIWRALQGVVVTGTWHASDAGEGIDRGQISLRSGENLDGVPKPQQYGFRSRPLDGAELVCVRRGAKADGPIVICVDDRRYHLAAMADGEVAIYDDLGSYVHLQRGGKIEVKAAGGLTVVGDLKVQGKIEATGDVADSIGTLALFRQKYNVHTHSAPGGSTGTPTPTA